MKKILLTLAVLMLASPAWAVDTVDITAVADGNKVTISYASTGVLPRAFSLNIQLDDDASIVAVGDVNPDFPIHPGTISIDLSGPEPSIDYGTPVAPQSDLPSDTLPGLGTNGITIEMGSLYAPTGPGSPNAPDPCGILLSIILDPPSDGNDLQTCLTFTGNVARAGSDGVVLEDPALDPAVTVPVPNNVCVDFPPDEEPTCWDASECVGQPEGDATCDGAVNLADLLALKGAWGASAPWTAPKCCADFNQSGAVNLGDLLILKGGWGKSGLLPATKNQDCP